MPEATADAAETTTEATTTTETATDTVDLAAELEKWKSLSKKNEERAKTNAKAAAELEELRKTAMTDQERAVAEAKAQGLAEGVRSASSKVVEAEVRAAAKGRVADVDALVEVLDPSKFLTDDGEVDRDAINAWVDRFAPQGEQRTKDGFPDLAQGTRSTELALGSDPLTQTLKNKLGIR